MIPRVYIETSVISYLTSRPSLNAIYAGHQKITQDWWAHARPNFEVYVSELVVDEAADGDPDAARRRLEAIVSIPRLISTPTALELSQRLIENGGLPAKAIADSLHLAISAVERIEYLLTWNCRHLANAVLRPRIEGICLDHGYRAPIICTPEALMEVS